MQASGAGSVIAKLGLFRALEGLWYARWCNGQTRA